MLIAFTIGLILGVWGTVALVVYWVYRKTKRAELPAPKLMPRGRVKPWSELDRVARLKRLEAVDCLLGWVLGDEPYPHGKLWRIER